VQHITAAGDGEPKASPAQFAPCSAEFGTCIEFPWVDALSTDPSMHMLLIEKEQHLMLAKELEVHSIREGVSAAAVALLAIVLSKVSTLCVMNYLFCDLKAPVRPAIIGLDSVRASQLSMWK